MSHNSSNPSATNNTIIEDDVIDIKQIILNVFRYWPLFLLSAAICLVIAYFVADYSAPNWHIASKLLVTDDKNSPQASLGSMGGDLGTLLNAKSNSDNEIQILKSRTLMENVVKDMQLNVRTYVKDGFKKREVFEEAPFTLAISYNTDTVLTKEYTINLTGANTFNLISEGDKVEKNEKFGNVIRLGQYNILLRHKTGYSNSGTYTIVIQPIDGTVFDFSQNFSVGLSDKQATTIDLSLNYPHPAKGEAILNTFMQTYLRLNLQNEKLTADSTIKYIESRIGLVSKDLNNIEKQFEEYKTNNNVPNITEQSKTLVASASDYFDKLAQQETQLSIINDIERTLKNPTNRNFIPNSLLSATDQSFGQAISAYNELLQARDKATLSYTDDNPVVQNLDVQIASVRVNLLKNIETYRKTLQVGKTELQKQNSGFTGQLKQLPSKERTYLDFSRQQSLKQELYIYLLKKREETAISRNSTISSSRIIDSAKSDFAPFKPKKAFMYMIGLFIGLLLPGIYLFVKNFLNVRIETKSDVEKMTKVSVLGEIGHNSDKQSLVVGRNSRSVISEQFRSLRTNLQFALNSSKSNVLLFTSSMSGEGKSFLSLNLGSALSLTGKKVVFMEMDLRKPKLSESIGLSIENGYTNYAISNDDNFDMSKLLKPLSFDENCFLISSGPIPPNPSELLISNKLEKLLTYLKERFDYIIIDCAPVGLVTDALIIEKQADLVFYVLRQNFTYKAQLNIINEIKNINKVENLYLIINDITNHQAGYSSFKQAYGYGIEDDSNKRWFDKLKFWN